MAVDSKNACSRAVVEPQVLLPCISGRYKIGAASMIHTQEIDGPTFRSQPTFIDLFCGCGGFTLGMLRAGFACLAAIDFNTEAVATLKANLPEVENPLERDLTKFGPEKLARHLDARDVEVIVGGPPCQGFSNVRRVDGSNHGRRLKPDQRRHLYREFLRYVTYFQPSVFVMENVLGIRTAAGGEYFTRVQQEARDLGRADGRPGYRVHTQVEDAWDLGVPQKRRRQLIVGVRSDLPGYFLPILKPAPRAQPRTLLGAAIGDLPILRPGGGLNESAYDTQRLAEHIRIHGDMARNYLINVLELERATLLTNHVARPHNARDLRDFARLKEGENSAVAMRDRGVKFEFPYDKSSFRDRYTRQSRWKPCSTIVAHLSKDGLMFIHPTQTRSLTPREAARVQSFPDWFRFSKAQTHAFRLIGNAVPPLIGESVGLAVLDFMRTNGRVIGGGFRRGASGDGSRTKPRRDSINWRELEHLIRLNRRELRSLSRDVLLHSWSSLLSLLPGLHPQNAIDHGDMIEVVPMEGSLPEAVASTLSRRYSRTGWPIALEAVGCEARRRYELGEISQDEFFCAGELTVADTGAAPTGAKSRGA